MWEEINTRYNCTNASRVTMGPTVKVIGADRVCMCHKVNVKKLSWWCSLLANLNVYSKALRVKSIAFKADGVTSSMNSEQNQDNVGTSRCKNHRVSHRGGDCDLLPLYFPGLFRRGHYRECHACHRRRPSRSTRVVCLDRRGLQYGVGKSAAYLGEGLRRFRTEACLANGRSHLLRWQHRRCHVTFDRGADCWPCSPRTRCWRMARDSQRLHN